MTKDDIKIRLISIGYPQTPGLDQTVDRLIGFTGEPKEMLEAWMERVVVPEFDSIYGISSSFLREKLGMKDPAIIIAFAMLLDNPKENADYLKQLVEKRFDFNPNI